MEGSRKDGGRMEEGGRDERSMGGRTGRSFANLTAKPTKEVKGQAEKCPDG